MFRKGKATQQKSLFDEELIESLALDFRFHYALGIQDIEKERICINTLTNFHRRLVEHEVKTGENLLQQEFASLSTRLAENIDLNFSMARMDSMMIASSCKVLTRLELVFTVIRNMIQTMEKLKISIPKIFKPYLESQYKKTMLYEARTDEA
jgi:hypothetical protein